MGECCMMRDKMSACETCETFEVMLREVSHYRTNSYEIVLSQGIRCLERRGNLKLKSSCILGNVIQDWVDVVVGVGYAQAFNTALCARVQKLGRHTLILDSFEKECFFCRYKLGWGNLTSQHCWVILLSSKCQFHLQWGMKHYTKIFMLINRLNTHHLHKYLMLRIRDVHYGTFRGSGIFRNFYFESRISNPISE